MSQPNPKSIPFKAIRIVHEDNSWFVSGKINQAKGAVILTRVEGDISNPCKVISALAHWLNNGGNEFSDARDTAKYIRTIQIKL